MRPGVAREFLEHISKDLKINQLSDWYNVSAKDVRKFGGGTLQLPQALRVAFPEHQWDLALFKQRGFPKL